MGNSKLSESFRFRIHCFTILGMTLMTPIFVLILDGLLDKSVDTDTIGLIYRIGLSSIFFICGFCTLRILNAIIERKENV